MGIPDYQMLMRPLLVLADEGKAKTLVEAENLLADRFNLSQSEREARLPSGQQTILRNRTGWASFYLTRAGLLDKPKRGIFFITDAGRAWLSANSAAITTEDLLSIPQFHAFYKDGRKIDGFANRTQDQNTREQTPDEVLQSAHETLRSELAADILDRLLKSSPGFFEHVVVELLVAMGYGGSLQDAGRRIGKSGDGGIDGIIKEDRLGLDTIYIQAKRWQGCVGRPEIQKFVGALQGQRARKGVFMTTSSYSVDARQYVAQIDTKVVLLDGHQIADLMIDHDVGVTPVTRYVIKRVDSDYFEVD